MKRASLYTTFLLVTSSVASIAAAKTVPVCTASTGDTKFVTDTVHAFYEAERTGSGARWRELTTPDFYMFHEGNVEWTPDNFEKWIDGEHAALQKDKAARWTMDLIDLKVSTDCATALTTQVVHNVIEMPSRKERGHFDEEYQESLWLRKAAGSGWRIAFWHVTKKLPSEANDKK